eukprot:7160768-Pyramimonas_sp.AAC.1
MLDSCGDGGDRRGSAANNDLSAAGATETASYCNCPCTTKRCTLKQLSRTFWPSRRLRAPGSGRSDRGGTGGKRGPSGASLARGSCRRQCTAQHSGRRCRR